MPTSACPGRRRRFDRLDVVQLVHTNGIVDEVLVHEAAICDIGGHAEMFGVSLVTNMAAGMTDQAISADDVSRLRSGAADRLAAILESVLV